MLVKGILYGLRGELFYVLAGKQDSRTALAQSIKRSYTRKLGPQPQHAYAAEVRSAFPSEWENYFKFCVVRNPFDKVVSDYYWKTRSLNDPPSFSEFLRAIKEGDSNSGLVPLRPDNWPIYTIDDEVVVDSVVRFENLKNGLSEVLRKIGIEWDGVLPRVKSGIRTDREGQSTSYRMIYKRKDRELVQRLYRNEIDYFGYEF